MKKRGRSARRRFESLLYSGLKPDARAAMPRWQRGLHAAAKRLEPILYLGLKPKPGLMRPPLTRRQKVGIALVVLVTGAALGGLAAALTKRRVPEPRFGPDMPAVADILPKNLPAGVKSPLEVLTLEVRGSGGQRHVFGVVRNSGPAAVPSAALVLDLVNGAGTKVGSTTATLANIPPRQHAKFLIPLQTRDVDFVLVREVRVETGAKP